MKRVEGVVARRRDPAVGTAVERQARIAAECWSRFEEFEDPAEWARVLTGEMDELCELTGRELPRFEVAS